MTMSSDHVFHVAYKTAEELIADDENRRRREWDRKLREEAAAFRQHSLYGAWVVGPDEGVSTSTLDIYSTSRSQALPGTRASGWNGRPALRIHTNLPRAGDNGLPHDWTMRVFNVRARTSEILTKEVLDFAAVMNVEYRYGGRLIKEATLLELLHAPAHCPDELAPVEMLVEMKHQESYRMIVTPEATAPIEAFHEHLQKTTFSQKPKNVVGVEKWYREATFWIYLDGYLKREVG
jgi:hypothetical protein